MDACSIGLDLGGTKIAAALVDRNGLVISKLVEPTLSEKGVESVISRMAGCVRTLLDRAGQPVVGLGIGAAGMTDSKQGSVIQASNLMWKDVPVRRLLMDQLGADWSNRIWVDKDTNAAVLGEMLYGAGKGSRHLLYVTVGTGIGGGMVLDGKLYHGASEGASDIGHLVLDPNGPLCGCGKHGCVEALASGSAIARNALVALQSGSAAGLLSWTEGQTLTAQTVVEAAQQGDTFALGILETAGYWLGRALALYADINNPERIIIGGGVVAARDLLLEPVKRAITQYALPANAKTAQVLPAGLGSDSGVVGAAALVWQHYQSIEEEI